MEKEEIRTKSPFVKNEDIKKVNTQFAYYICNRSGIANLKSEGKHHGEIGGSVKCGKTCTAFMTFTQEQQQKAIKISYQSVDAGHEMEVGKHNFHQDDRIDLVALLKAGEQSTKIIEGIRKKCLPTE
ncbi:hypothetical protein TNCV_1881421 [Trichonephila clavipes]|nr:hypothetical protein TNCV_1881421 [Trichonephila clavipes]